MIWVPPQMLLCSKRLDVAVKVLYGREIVGQRSMFSDSDAADLYGRHIHLRTRGTEPNAYYRKDSVAAYRRQFSSVIADVSRNGFDPSEPIPVSRKSGIILNGAHRLAAALVLGIDRVPVLYDDNALGRAWGFDWFFENGFSRREISEIALAWLELREFRDVVGILWPSEPNIHADIIAYLRTLGDFLYLEKWDIGSAIREMVFDVYAYDYGASVEFIANNIARKSERLERKGGEVVVFALSGEGLSGKFVKDSVRGRFGESIEAPDFDIIHCGNDDEESRYLAMVAINQANMGAYSCRTQPSQALIKRLQALEEYCRRNDIPAREVCVVGGACLDVIGVKASDDLDFVCSYGIRRRNFFPGSGNILEEIDIANENYCKKIDVGDWWSDDDLINYGDLHCLVRGFKFARSELVVERKRYSLRDKDRIDIARYAHKRLGHDLSKAISQHQIKNKPIDLLSFKEYIGEAEKRHNDGVLHEAAYYYKRVTEFWPNQPEGWCGLGLCALQRGDLEISVKYFERALEIDPLHHASHKNLLVVKERLALKREANF